MATIETSLLVDDAGKPRFLQADDIVAASPAYMIAAQLSLAGALVNGLFGGIVASAEPHGTNPAAAIGAIAFAFVAFAIVYYRILGRFARTPTIATRRASATFFACEVALFAIVACGQVFVVSPHVQHGAAAIAGYDRVALVIALVPAALAALAYFGILRTDVEKLARDGYVAGT